MQLHWIRGECFLLGLSYAETFKNDSRDRRPVRTICDVVRGNWQSFVMKLQKKVHSHIIQVRSIHIFGFLQRFNSVCCHTDTIDYDYRLLHKVTHKFAYRQYGLYTYMCRVETSLMTHVWRNYDVALTSHWITAVKQLTSTCRQFYLGNIFPLTSSTGPGSVYYGHGTPAMTSLWRHAARAGEATATSFWHWSYGVTWLLKQRQRTNFMRCGWCWIDTKKRC